MSEIWKEIEGYKGRYWVSDLGRVKSRYRVLKGRPGGTSKYLRVQLGAGKGNEYLVHRLVANAFVENLEGYPEVNHLNKKVTDNRAINLEWVTRRMNNIHGWGKSCQFTRDGVVFTWFPCIADAAERIKSNTANISRLLRGIKYNHVKGWRLV